MLKIKKLRNNSQKLSNLSKNQPKSILILLNSKSSKARTTNVPDGGNF